MTRLESVETRMNNWTEQRSFPVIDFHSHVLPKMDDGSKSVDMSLKMLQNSGQAGVDVMAATPHFYGHRESICDFLKRRDEAWCALSAAIQPQHPRVVLGAEVAFFSDIECTQELEALCFAGTRTLLLEMPFSPWSGYELDAVSALCLDRGFTIILAHIERFFDRQKDGDILRSLLQLPLYLQINAGTLLSWRRRGRWLDALAAGRAHLLGSDCHDMTSRPPNLAQARELLGRKIGTQALENMDRLGSSLLR